MRSCLMIPALLSCLTIGSCTKTPAEQPIVEEAFFCDLVTERFRYTQAEIDERTVKWPANLAREFRINLHYDRECVEKKEVE